MAPVRRRLTTEEAAERAHAGQHPAYDWDGRPAMEVRGFRLERVFRYEDTEGEPLPEVPEVGYVTGDTPDGAWDAIAALIEGEGYRMTAEPESSGARGHTNYTDRIVNIDRGPSPAERAHVLIHELGHIRAGHTPPAPSSPTSNRTTSRTAMRMATPPRPGRGAAASG